ncbi:hypothetical protein VP01_4886g1 [Puccinia sorghi]|uniref:Uncharacterized protein n=1 Tax=Puccinia sorghi TaxID=27349 RepID=A0A0L6UM82_9BASI|nr:hypothetical protein VP01_4886g1 [Puccinia sorghi]
MELLHQYIENPKEQRWHIFACLLIHRRMNLDFGVKELPPVAVTSSRRHIFGVVVRGSDTNTCGMRATQFSRIHPDSVTKPEYSCISAKHLPTGFYQGDSEARNNVDQFLRTTVKHERTTLCSLSVQNRADKTQYHERTHQSDISGKLSNMTRQGPIRSPQAAVGSSLP